VVQGSFLIGTSLRKYYMKTKQKKQSTFHKYFLFLSLFHHLERKGGINMRRILTIFLVFSILFTLNSCVSNKDTSKPSQKTTTKEELGNKDTTAIINSSAKINLNDYVSVNFDGYNLAGRASVIFDTEKFLLDHINDVSFNKKNMQVYKEVYGDTEKSAANEIVKHISVHLDKTNKLSNEDIVKLTWTIDKEKIETYFVCDYAYTSETITVKGLKEAGTFNPFEDIEVSFSGTNSNGRADVWNNDFKYGGSYTVIPDSNLKNGDKVTVAYSCEDTATMIKKYGKYPSVLKKTYTVSGLDSLSIYIDIDDSEGDDKPIEEFVIPEICNVTFLPDVPNAVNGDIKFAVRNKSTKKTYDYILEENNNYFLIVELPVGHYEITQVNISNNKNNRFEAEPSSFTVGNTMNCIVNFNITDTKT